MDFNGWHIIIQYDKPYETLQNENFFAVIDGDNDMSVLLKSVDQGLKVMKSDYGNMLTFNAEEKTLTVEIVNPFEND